MAELPVTRLGVEFDLAGKHAQLATFKRAIDFRRTRRVDLTAIQPRTYPIDSYVDALTEAATKTGRDAVKISFAF